jgi:hypothetical protein
MVLTAILTVATAATASCGGASSTWGSTGGCRIQEPQTAGNIVIWFLGDVQQGRDPAIMGGVDDPFGCAYASLCDARRREVSEDRFRSTKGAVVSGLLTADTWEGSSVYVDLGLVDERPDGATLDPGLSATWVEIQATRFEHLDAQTILSGSGVTEKWRVDLVREHGGWRLCHFTPVS